MTARNNRKFSPSSLTHSTAHHLLAVGELLDQQGYARVSDIARNLGVTRGSVSVVMRSLRDSGYVEQDENHFYRLTEQGQRTVSSLRARHKVVERFLSEVLGLAPKQSHRESCRVENLIEAPTTRRLLKLLEFWEERGLAEAFEATGLDTCAICRGEDMEHCPCCGLECLEGICSRSE